MSYTYTAWSVVFGEQPTASKWNQLGTNDASFNERIGANFSAGLVSPIWYEELARTTLGVAGDTLSAPTIATRKYLRVLISLTGTGAVDLYLRFNNDSGANYANKQMVEGGAGSASTSQTQITLSTGDSNKNYQTVIDIVNIAAKEKLVTYANFINTVGAASAPVAVDGKGKWANTSNAITRIDVLNANSGDYTSGAEIVILGHD